MTHIHSHVFCSLVLLNVSENAVKIILLYAPNITWKSWFVNSVKRPTCFSDSISLRKCEYHEKQVEFQEMFE